MQDERTYILLIEDDRIDQMAFERSMQAHKKAFNWDMVSNVTSAFEKLRTVRYDIIISDFNLSDGNAFEILDDVHDIPVLVTTGAGDEKIAATTIKKGAYEYLIKDTEQNYLKVLPQIINNAIEHKKIEKESWLLSNALMSVNELVSITDHENMLLFVNDAFCKKYGYKKSEVIGKPVYLIYPDDAPPGKGEEILQATLQGGWSGELINKKKDGTTFPILLSTSVIENQKGETTYLIGVAKDITESRKAKKALSAEKEKLAVTLRSIGGGVITTDQDGKIELLSTAAEEITGWKQSEAEGLQFSDVFRIESGSETHEIIQYLLNSGKAIKNDNPFNLIDKKGKIKKVISNAVPIKSDSDRVLGVVVAFQDITEILKLEEDRRKAQNLESIGILAGGIAHDFNNFLTAIIGNISLAQIQADPGEKFYIYLEKALKACEQSKALTQQLLTFSKGGAPIKKNASIVEIVKDTSDFISRGSQIRCSYNIDKDMWAANVDIGQISQVIHNLMINAIQAMSKGGEVKISIYNKTIEPDIDAKQKSVKPGNYVGIKICDTGTGIPNDIIDKIFDPYFTTKTTGNGLGLATCYSIIKQHDGHIFVDSKVGMGTEFTIFLPAIPGLRVSVSSETLEIYAGKAKILIMDDEPSILDVTTQMLETLGGIPTVTKNGNEALQVYRETYGTGDEFDLVILDITIPGGMGGIETLETLKKINPHVKAVVTSGYSDDPVMSDFDKHGFSGRLVKPFNIRDLSAVLHNIMDKEVPVSA